RADLVTGVQTCALPIYPMIGLDTIRRMGATYFKAFGMVLLVQAVGLIVGVVISVITAPLAVPFFGNLPGTFIDATIAFYFNLVRSEERRVGQECRYRG